MTGVRLRKFALLALKLAVSLVLLKVVFDLASEETFQTLRDQPKHWGKLALAAVCVLAAVVLTFIRWMLLVQALELPFRLGDALRLGFLGYLFHFVSLGSVGGDLFKAVFIAREQPGRRAEAVASVVVDRLVGLYSLFVVAAIATLGARLYSESDTPEVRYIARAALVCAGVGTVTLLSLMIPAFTGGRAVHLASRLPGVGPTVVKIVLALRLYRQRYPRVLLAIGLSLFVHSLCALGFYFIAQGFPGPSPTLAEHFLIVPLSLLAGAVPLPLAGLGAFEAVLDFMYHHVSRTIVVPYGRGLIVALSYRVITITIALVGVGYYRTSRRAVSAAMHEAEAEVGTEG